MTDVDTGTDRRTLLKRTAALGAAAYVAPQVISMSPAGAATLGCYAVRLVTTGACSSEPVPITDACDDMGLQGADPLQGCQAASSDSCNSSNNGLTLDGVFLPVVGFSGSIEDGCEFKFGHISVSESGRTYCAQASGPGSSGTTFGSFGTITLGAFGHNFSAQRFSPATLNHVILVWCCDAGSVLACNNPTTTTT